MPDTETLTQYARITQALGGDGHATAKLMWSKAGAKITDELRCAVYKVSNQRGNQDVELVSTSETDFDKYIKKRARDQESYLLAAIEGGLGSAEVLTRMRAAAREKRELKQRLLNNFHDKAPPELQMQMLARWAMLATPKTKSARETAWNTMARYHPGLSAACDFAATRDHNVLCLYANRDTEAYSAVSAFFYANVTAAELGGIGYTPGWGRWSMLENCHAIYGALKGNMDFIVLSDATEELTLIEGYPRVGVTEMRWAVSQGGGISNDLTRQLRQKGAGKPAEGINTLGGCIVLTKDPTAHATTLPLFQQVFTPGHPAAAFAADPAALWAAIKPYASGGAAALKTAAEKVVAHARGI